MKGRTFTGRQCTACGRARLVPMEQPNHTINWSCPKCGWTRIGRGIKDSVVMGVDRG